MTESPRPADDATGIWYAAFGSNLFRARFCVYLTGGQIPGSPSGRVQEGARNPALPTGDRPFTIERTLLFTGRSGQWGDGGTAAIDSDHNPVTPTLGRAYRITLSQFEDVVRQENRLPQTPEIPLDLLAEQGHLDVSSNKYGRVAIVGEIDGDPVATITTPGRPANLQPAHESYLRVMARGLIESHRLGVEEAAGYLASRPGNAGLVDPGALAAALDGGRPLLHFD